MATVASEAPLVSLIIRTKNEERWIGSCLRAVFRQDYPNFEVILVDNMSTDQTVAKARQFPVTLVEIEKFLPGRAINDGIRASRGDIVVCLSGHCIPVNPQWLSKLVANLDDPDVAGVYGRQEPLSYSSPLDKRDLMITFGLDRKVQMKDSFFHNANSALRRDVWERFPFDEQVTNIEDRLWGRQVLSAGMKIVYEPEASVYHYHGIHQEMNLDRARNVVRIMEQIEGIGRKANGHDLDEMTIVAIVPSRGPARLCGKRPLLEYTIRDACASKYISRTIVATDNPDTAALARNLGAETPFLRPPELSEDHVDVIDVLQYSLDQLESQGTVPDLVVILEETQPFRPTGMIDEMIRQTIRDGMDSVIAAKPETRRLWLREQAATRDLGEGIFMPRQFKESIAYIGLLGLGCVTHPPFLRDGSVLGGKIGFHEVVEPYATVELRSEAALTASGTLLEQWFKERNK